MSIVIPSGVEITIAGQNVKVKGPKGELTHNLPEAITAAKNEDGSVAVTRANDERLSKSLHGLSRTLINNMVIGVTEGYSKRMELSGTGYRVALKGADLEFALDHEPRYGRARKLLHRLDPRAEAALAADESAANLIVDLPLESVDPRRQPTHAAPHGLPHGFLCRSKRLVKPLP